MHPLAVYPTQTRCSSLKPLKVSELYPSYTRVIPELYPSYTRVIPELYLSYTKPQLTIECPPGPRGRQGPSYRLDCIHQLSIKLRQDIPPRDERGILGHERGRWSPGLVSLTFVKLLPVPSSLHLKFEEKVDLE